MTSHFSLLVVAVVACLPITASADAPRLVGADAPRVSVLDCARLFDPVAGKLLGETTVVVEDGQVKGIHAAPIDPQAFERPRETPARPSTTSSWPMPPACPA